MKMVKFSMRWVFVLLFLSGVLLAGCRDRPAVPEATASPATPSSAPATETVVIPTVTPAATEAAPTDTPLPVATSEQPTATPAAATSTATPAVTATPTDSALPTATLSPTASPEPVSEPGLAPGQRSTATLTAGEFRVYPYSGAEFQPAMIFVEVADTLDVALAAYEGEAPAGTNLDDLTPLTESDVSEAGGPEIMVFTPEADGTYSLVAQNVADSAGEYTIYLFDGTTDAPDVALQASDTLAAGETKTYTAQSNGRRPVLVFADPTDQSDVVVEVSDDSGSVVSEADFSGPGSAEAVYLLPQETTTYTVRVSEANGAVSAYNLVIVALADEP